MNNTSGEDDVVIIPSDWYIESTEFLWNIVNENCKDLTTVDEENGEIEGNVEALLSSYESIKNSTDWQFDSLAYSKSSIELSNISKTKSSNKWDSSWNTP